MRTNPRRRTNRINSPTHGSVLTQVRTPGKRRRIAVALAVTSGLAGAIAAAILVVFADGGVVVKGDYAQAADKSTAAIGVKFETKRLDVRTGQAAKLSGQVGEGIGDSVDTRDGGAVYTVESHQAATSVLDVALQIRRGRGWRTVAGVKSDNKGNFDLAKRVSGPLRAAARLRISNQSDVVTRDLGQLNVYVKGGASYYGEGMWGAKTACGDTLKPDLMGTAHKTLPCGTKVTVRYGGKSVVVSVIDRGPFVSGRDWDLTTPAAEKLGLISAGVGTVEAAYQP